MTKGQRLYRGVLAKILDLIDSGEYPVGGRLPPERELAQRFNVSRPTIREAIIALETLERVEVKIGSGVYVLKHHTLLDHVYQSVTAFELTEARAMIEAETVALAATMITPEHLEKLKQSLESMARENECGELATGNADREFHHVIAEATQNKMLMLIADQLWQVRDSAPRVFQAYKSICEQDGTKRVDEHRAIYEALLKRDAATARAAMHEHFAKILDKLIATEEAEQLEKARRQAAEARKRFLLNHVVSDT